MPTKVIRLYKQFQPEHYDLRLRLDADAMSFSGTVSITGKKVGRPTQRITLHQKDLTISAATITITDKKGGQQVIPVSRINRQKSFDEVRLHTDQPLYPGNYTVELTFSGKISRQMEGIYPCYFDLNGEQQMLLATQFESHHAREAFPCIDEPEAKATFALELTTKPAKAIIANTPVVSQKESNGLVVTKFETTPRMSTYLLAFAYGNLDYLEAETKDGVTVRTYATPENVVHTKFALDVAVRCLEFYNQYFDIPYPLAKCDFIALPDFASGAMENWGCITFREQALLVDKANTSLPVKQYVANVVAHELTHQWFGNLVTMRWWNDLWLNESFASWMSYLAVDQLFPDWDVWTQFVVDEQAAALKLDALENTHPIVVAINHPDEIRTIFDAISYEKGASVLQMLKHYLGDDAFRDGLRHYLKEHAYQNAETSDLWHALETISGKPVTDFMAAWTTQPGYPVINVTADKVSQSRFFLNHAASKTDALWPIPLLPEKASDVTVLADKEIAIDQASLGLLNKDRTGFYRVSYDQTLIDSFAASIPQLAPLDRLGLLADALEAAKAGFGTTVNALSLLEAYKDENDTFVWDIIVSVLATIKATMRDEALREAMKPLGRTLTDAQLTRLGWTAQPNESHFDTLLRPTILSLASASDNKAVVDEALKRFAAMKQPEDIDPDLRGIVYGVAAREGNETDFEKLLAMHNASRSSEERITLSAALTGFKQPELIERALGLITTDTVRLQDTAYWIAYSFSNRHARDLTWQWLVKNWDWLEKNLGSDLSFYRMPNYAARNYSDAAFLPEFTAFFEKHMNASFERPVKQAIETITWQADWRDRDLDAIKAHFDI